MATRNRAASENWGRSCITNSVTVARSLVRLMNVDAIVSGPMWGGAIIFSYLKQEIMEEQRG
jgi:pyocin large subunit-like protein